MQGKLNIVLVHPDKQHSFQTAIALQKQNFLSYYITTVYDKPFSFTRLCASLLRGNFKQKLKAHACQDIDDTKVKQYYELMSLFLLILVRIDKKGELYAKLKILRDKWFNKKVARFCKKKNIDVIISFDVLSAQLYEELDKKNIRVLKILDMSAPYFPYMCDVFSQEATKSSASQLDEMLKTTLFEYWNTQAKKEISIADAFFVASDFTKKSLTESGVDPKKIYKCKYGIDQMFLEYPLAKQWNNDIFNCIYVGNITEQKGCRYLLETMKATEDKNINYTFAGAYSLNNPIVKECYERANFLGYIPKSELIRNLSNSQVMIFPSLSDGFGFAVLEAMARGVVPICSKNAGVSDLIKHNKNGFIVNAMNSHAIYECLIKLYSNPELLKQMSEDARKSVECIKWENYYKDINDSILNILQSKD